jgi:integrase/recombinase XerD
VNNLTLSQAAEGCLLYKSATGCSDHTILDYRNGYSKLLAYLSDDPPFAAITRAQLVAFFAWLQNGHVSEPDGVAPRGRIRLAPKSIYNIHVALSSLWQWGVKENYVTENLIRTIDAPQFEPPAIEPFTKEDIQAMLKACAATRTWKTRQHTTSRRRTADRDRVIILLLLDTGIRRSELCDLTIADLNLTANSILIRGKGSGRDKKERIVYFGRGTARALWRYITPRLQSANNNDPLFPVGSADYPRQMKPDVLRRLLKRIGDRAGVANVHPHRFRHTFAITYLRNAGDPFTLQILLGHSNLEMVKRYLRIVRADCADAHGRASPVDNWRL